MTLRPNESIQALPKRIDVLHNVAVRRDGLSAWENIVLVSHEGMAKLQEADPKAKGLPEYAALIIDSGPTSVVLFPTPDKTYEAMVDGAIRVRM